MRERFRGGSCGESQPLILYVVYLQVGAVNVAAFCRKKISPQLRGLLLCLNVVKFSCGKIGSIFNYSILPYQLFGLTVYREE